MARAKKTVRVSAAQRRAEEFALQVDTVLGELREVLLRKHAAYGDSALSPLRVFSQATVEQGMRTRIDDKLARIRRTGLQAADEDTLLDLQGYLVLLRIARIAAR